MTDLEFLETFHSLPPEKQAAVLIAMRELLLSQRSVPGSPASADVKAQ